MASRKNQKIKDTDDEVNLVEINSTNSLLQLQNETDEYNVAYENDASTVYLQQGQYVIPIAGHTVVLQDNEGDLKYIINNIVTDEELREANETEPSIIYYAGEFGDQSIFEEEEMGETEEENVMPLAKRIKLEPNYLDEYQNENNFVQVQEETADSNGLVLAADDSDQGQLPQSQYQYAILKNGKLHLQTLDFVDAETDGQFTTAEEKDQHQQLQEQLAAFQESITMDDASLSTSTVDLDKITGKNLITGQTVTLDSYFDKLQRRLFTVDVADQCFSYKTKKLQNDSGKKDPTEGNFINKKIVVGKTLKGKKIVGKILSVQLPPAAGSNAEQNEARKEPKRTIPLPVVVNTEAVAVGQTTDSEETRAGIISDRNDSTSPVWSKEPQEAEFEQVLQPHILIKKHVITRANFDYNIGNTLSGLMGLETVQRKLQNKNLVVKLVEKVFNPNTEAYNKTVSYVYGHMDLIRMEKEGSDEQQWMFILHNENSQSQTNSSNKDGDENVSTQENVGTAKASTDEEGEEISLEMEEGMWAKYNETTSLTIIITVDKNGKKSTRVNLSPQQSDTRCPVCSKDFKHSLQMRRHLNNVHLNEKSVKCELCDKTFANQTVLQRHQKVHTGERWYQCGKCSKSFNTAGGLKRHLTVHDPSLRPLECSVCLQRFTDESSLRKHLLIHTGIKAYACEVCNRAFINQGDLNFHRRIHDPVKQFSCEVCGREFSRHSNLMRHAVIHRGAGALHRCDICGCSYSFVSSLTRHIVQKHIGQ